MILEGIDILNEPWSIRECLHTIKKVLEYGRLIGDDTDLENYSNNIILKMLKEQEKIGNLEALEKCKENEISMLARELMEEYFSNENLV